MTPSFLYRIAAPVVTVSTVCRHAGWAPLLKIIVNDAQPGAIVETHTSTRYGMVMEELRVVRRSDIEVPLLGREDTNTATPTTQG